MKEQIAKYLLDIKAVTLQPENPYTWSSGLIAPIYTDNRLTLSYPKIRTEIEMEFVRIIKENYPDVEMIIGTATAGIAHAAIIAHMLDLPMGYVRGSAKGHGKKNRIEGKIHTGQKVIVIEDLISTGLSSLQVVKQLREKEVNVLGILSIFTYQLEEAEINFKNQNITCLSLTNYESLIQVALKENYITKDGFIQLTKFHNSPHNQDWMK